MQKTPITQIPEEIPTVFLSFLRGAQLYDSSCSSGARVYYINKEGGFFLKSAPGGTLRSEAAMTRYFHDKGLSAQVLGYESGNRDWLLTAKIPGEDCTHAMYLEDPIRLCDTTASLLRQLHSLPVPDCPIHHTARYLDTARRNYRNGRWDPSLFDDAFSSAEDAWHIAESCAPYLKSDTLLHGDYCLPNILLNNWAFSGFIDLGNSGLGDRHVDLFWGIWTLRFNLKTDRYTNRFLDVYGRENVEPEMLRAVAAFEAFG